MPEQTNRQLVRWIGIGIVAVVVVVGAGFFYLGGKSGVLRFFKRDLTMTVCRGDSRETCRSEHWISCETDPVAFMKNVRPDVCVNVTAKKVSEVPGIKCSSTTFEMKCSAR